MENSKLMTPLFYDGMFNREGRRMRAVLEKEISDGTQTYRLWRAAGKPDLDYPRLKMTSISSMYHRPNTGQRSARSKS